MLLVAVIYRHCWLDREVTSQKQFAAAHVGVGKSQTCCLPQGCFLEGSSAQGIAGIGVVTGCDPSIGSYSNSRLREFSAAPAHWGFYLSAECCEGPNNLVASIAPVQ